MKNILTLLILITTSLIAFSQDNVTVNLSVKGKDLKYIGSFVNSDIHDILFDTVKVKLKGANIPDGADVTLNNIPSGEWLSVANRLRFDFIALNADVFSRIETSLKALNNAYITQGLADQKNSVQASFNSIKDGAVFRFKHN